MARRFWTPARIAELRRLWSAGQTAAAIGAALGGITRSAVLGKVFRLRLAPAGRGRSAPQASDEAPARRRAGKPPPQPAQIKARRKTLFELSNECCRWPYGELGERRFFFCGAAGADVARGIPYCPRHMQRAYIVPPSLVKPLHKLIARPGEKFPIGDDDATSRSFPRRRESSEAEPARITLSGFPLLRERAVTNKRKFG
jgi:GcrA cell cycle regulator